MHELSLMESTLAIAVGEAEKQHARKITGLRMRVGEFSGVVVEALEFAFSALTPGTLAEGAVLQIDKVPLSCYCSTCRRDVALPTLAFECPVCGGSALEIRKGRELEIVSIEVEDV